MEILVHTTQTAILRDGNRSFMVTAHTRPDHFSFGMWTNDTLGVSQLADIDRTSQGFKVYGKLTPVSLLVAYDTDSKTLLAHLEYLVRLYKSGHFSAAFVAAGE